MLAEMCLVLICVCLFVLMYPSHLSDVDEEYVTFADSYLLLQSEALRQSQPVDEANGHEIIHFNAKGNISRASTIHFRNHEIICELGGGRLEFR